MKLSCTKENLHQGLAITSHVSTKNVNLPILSNILLRADERGLKLISTNLEIAIICNVRGKVEQQGEYTIPSKLVYEYINLLPNEIINIDLLDDSLAISCGKSKTKIKGINSSEFPLIPPVNEGIKYSVSVNEFKNALSKTLFATATNESRPTLSGVFISFNNEDEGVGKMIVAATDSYRLAEVVMNISGGSKEHKEVIIPQRTLAELNRIFSIFKDDVEASPTVEIEISDNQVVFKYGSVELTSRTIEGKYPDYRQIIPNNSKTDVVLDKASFSQSIKTAALFSKTGLFDINMDISPSEGVVELSASDSSRGENQVKVDCEINGEKNSIAMNYRYLLDGINAMRSSEIFLKVIDASNPCVISAKNMPEEKYTYVVMPIRH